VDDFIYYTQDFMVYSMFLTLNKLSVIPEFVEMKAPSRPLGTNITKIDPVAEGKRGERLARCWEASSCNASHLASFLVVYVIRLHSLMMAHVYIKVTTANKFLLTNVTNEPSAYIV